MKKKLLYIFVSIILLMSFTLETYAIEKNDALTLSSYKVTISERDIINDLLKKSNTELKALGFSESEITNLRTLTDEVIAKKVKNMSDEELIDRGMSKQQIKIIRNETNIHKLAEESF